MEIESKEFRLLQNACIDKLKRKKIRKEESQKKKMSSDVKNRQKLLCLINKNMKNTKFKILHCKTLFAEIMHTNSGLDYCNKGMPSSP